MWHQQRQLSTLNQQWHTQLRHGRLSSISSQLAVATAVTDLQVQLKGASHGALAALLLHTPVPANLSLGHQSLLGINQGQKGIAYASCKPLLRLHSIDNGPQLKASDRTAVLSATCGRSRAQRSVVAVCSQTGCDAATSAALKAVHSVMAHLPKGVEADEYAAAPQAEESFRPAC